MNTKQSVWTGKIYQAALLAAFTVFFNILTLYLFYPVPVAMKERWICNHTSIDGKQLVFVGRARDVMTKWLVSWFLIVITLSIFGFFVPNRMQRWKAENTHFKMNY